MDLKPGTYIKSTEALDGSFFEAATLLITEYNDGGAVGFILNHPFGRTLNELAEFSHCRPEPLFTGGPVDGEHLYFLHRRPDLIEDGVPVADGIYTGGNFRQAVEALNEGALAAGQIRVFVGYCGWEAGELEGEIEEGSWKIVDAREVPDPLG